MTDRAIRLCSAGCYSPDQAKARFLKLLGAPPSAEETEPISDLRVRRVRGRRGGFSNVRQMKSDYRRDLVVLLSTFGCPQVTVVDCLGRAAPVVLGVSVHKKAKVADLLEAARAMLEPPEGEGERLVLTMGDLPLKADRVLDEYSFRAGAPELRAFRCVGSSGLDA